MSFKNTSQALLFLSRLVCFGRSDTYLLTHLLQVRKIDPSLFSWFILSKTASSFCVVVSATHVCIGESLVVTSLLSWLSGGPVAVRACVCACLPVCVSICCCSVEGPSEIPTVLLHSAFIACERTQIPCLFAPAVLMTPLISKSPWPDIPHIAGPPLSASPPPSTPPRCYSSERPAEGTTATRWTWLDCENTAGLLLLLSALNFPLDS